MQETRKVVYTDEMVDILYDKLFRQDKEYDKEFSETDSESDAKGIILFSSEKLVLTLMAEFIHPGILVYVRAKFQGHPAYSLIPFPHPIRSCSWNTPDIEDFRPVDSEHNQAILRNAVSFYFDSSFFESSLSSLCKMFGHPVVSIRKMEKIVLPVDEKVYTDKLLHHKNRVLEQLRESPSSNGERWVETTAFTAKGARISFISSSSDFVEIKISVDIDDDSCESVFVGFPLEKAFNASDCLQYLSKKFSSLQREVTRQTGRIVVLQF